MRKLLAALLLAVAAACNDSTGPGSGTLSGSYQLRTANGVVVPGIASQDVSGVYEVLRGRIVLRSDFSFVDSLSDRFTPTGGAAQPRIDVRTGTYVQTGNNVTLSFNSSTGLVSYSLTCIAVLAFGLAANTAVFSIVYSTILKPPPYPEPGRLVVVHNRFPQLPRKARRFPGS